MKFAATALFLALAMVAGCGSSEDEYLRASKIVEDYRPEVASAEHELSRFRDLAMKRSELQMAIMYKTKGQENAEATRDFQESLTETLIREKQLEDAVAAKKQKLQELVAARDALRD